MSFSSIPSTLSSLQALNGREAVVVDAGDGLLLQGDELLCGEVEPQARGLDVAGHVQRIVSLLLAPDAG